MTFQGNFLAVTGVAVVFLFWDALAYATGCALVKAFDHETKHHGTRAVYSDGASLFFTAPMAVNTDGAPISYHPDDPWGSTGRRPCTNNQLGPLNGDLSAPRIGAWCAWASIFAMTSSIAASIASSASLYGD